MPPRLVLALALLYAAPLGAQHEHGGGGTDSTRSPYADLADREIKALAVEDMAGLRAGEGMGLALAAELNGYPGPRHVLELAHDLGISPEVVRQLEAVRDSMRASAVALGERLIAAERRLDRALATHAIDDGTLRDMTSEIAGLTGELRYVHLRAHLAVTQLLTAEQVERYQRLRGYRR